MEKNIKVENTQRNTYLKLTDVSRPGGLYLKYWAVGSLEEEGQPRYPGDPIIKNIKFSNPIVCRSKDRGYNLFKILN